MIRSLFAVAVLVSALSLSAGGCRSCSSCHDYDPPVADCGCGCGRTGSAFTGCDGGCSSGGGESGECGTGSCGPTGCQSCGPGGDYVESTPADGEYVEYE